MTRSPEWPALPYEEWRDTCDTLHARTHVSRRRDLVRPVVEMLVGEGLPELDRLLQVVVDPVRRRLPRPPHNDVRLVSLHEDVLILAVPGVIERLHQLHVVLLGARCHSDPSFVRTARCASRVTRRVCSSSSRRKPAR